MPKGFRGNRTALGFLWLSVLVFLADWWTKQLALTHLVPYEALAVFPSVNLTLAFNTGAAFSFLDGGVWWPNLLFGCIALAISLGILIWLRRLPREDALMGVALSLILGGALGNLWDRISHKHVIDFMDLYIANWHWPVFNVADAAVCVGAGLIIFKWTRGEKPHTFTR
jgi:signal peptidase II